MGRSRFFGIVATGYVLLLYATSGVMRDVLNALKGGSGELFPWVAVMLCLLGLAGFVFLYRVKLLRLSLGRGLALLLVLAGYGLALTVLQIPEERIHLLQYGVLAWLVTEGLRGRLTSPWLHVASMAIVIATGIGDELVQWVRPNRVGDLRDVAINVVAAALAQALLVIPFSNTVGAAPSPRSSS